MLVVCRTAVVRFIHGDRKVRQPILKYFFHSCNSIQFNWINKHTVSMWLYKNPCRSCHVVTSLHQSVSCLSTVELQQCLFHRYECSLSNTTWHLILTELARMSLGIHFPILLCQKNQQSSTSELFPWHRDSSPGCFKHEEKSECMHHWTRWTFPTLYITFFFLSSM
jgi:hypothetical protein